MISLSDVFGKDDETLATTVVHNFHQRKPKGFLKSISYDTSCFWRVFLFKEVRGNDELVLTVKLSRKQRNENT